MHFLATARRTLVRYLGKAEPGLRRPVSISAARSRRAVLPVALLAILAVHTGATAWAQSEHPLSGRRIAPVMGMSGAEWLERSEREIEELPEAALDAIGIKPGMTVADVGAGVGYFTLRVAKRAGPTGKVYANDVQPEMLAMIKERAAKAGLNNVETVLGTESDPGLPKATMDLVLLVDVYHEFSRPQSMLRKIRDALKNTGRLVLLEYRKEDPHIPIRPEHKMSVDEARLEVEAEGYKLEKVLEVLPRQHILVFRKDIQ
ncbi:MAG: class I SAM-dependent methyltransferase [Acidobacteria bacterium]|nr:class I SAM-dependent methyltransferase [Acidobacteriota bacterium]MBI3279978.1 class I SAM-dependent methyltransferase [Acidobacteriota bacterium]